MALREGRRFAGVLPRLLLTRNVLPVASAPGGRSALSSLINTYPGCTLAQVNAALQLDAKEFKEKYGGEMPVQTDNIVFTCLAGIRSKTALDTATSLGYKDVQHYLGGWKDWVKNEQHN